MAKILKENSKLAVATAVHLLSVRCAVVNSVLGSSLSSKAQLHFITRYLLMSPDCFF
jgi:hypothetical protein